MQAAHFADHATSVRAAVVENERLATDTYRVRLDCAAIAATIEPGQFVMLRLTTLSDPLLGRPLALFDIAPGADGTPRLLDLVYLVVGKLTSRLARVRPGDEVALWGPLGAGFAQRAVDRLIMVGGGIGMTPFLALGGEFLGRRAFGIQRGPVRAAQVTFCYGARSKDYLAAIDRFEQLGIDVRVSTDDGSAGHHGRVTDLLAAALDESAGQGVHVVCCGPEPMMKATAALCAARAVSCEVSLETPMACGLGICFSCVTKVRDERGGWDYRRTCVEGPVFDAQTLEW